ncbi:hypothetical protein [Microbacterium sp. NPDC058345]|uniref:hypothetical protein n=1 Tax=Microbacterium sp. NPDC058345 TaxID=3346455 RepID=UPI00364C02DA
MSEHRKRASTARRRAARRRARKRMLRATWITVAVAVATSALLIVLGLLTAQRHEYCAERPQAFPATGVHGWRGDQLENAATIVRAAERMDLEREAQILGVMAAMGESSLHNIDYGDWETSGVTNPDGSRTTSVGLFQQQEWWGTAEERMDPATAATRFFARLRTIPGWQELPPSHAIHRVQINSDSEHYAPFHDDAMAVVDALSGACPA